MVKVMYNDKLVYKVVIWMFLEYIYEKRSTVLKWMKAPEGRLSLDHLKLCEPLDGDLE